MGGETSHSKGKERGPWFAIKSIKESILIGEALGKDKSYERKLLKEWSKHKGWEAAGDALPH